MSAALDMAEIASLVGAPARALILAALLDGRASTALELALAAGITPQTATAHLAKLVKGRLLTLHRQGRHRYFQLATPAVARTLEGIMALAADGPPRNRRPARMAADMRRARTCYDHIAGRTGVAITDALLARELVRLDGDAGEVTARGRRFFSAHAIDIETATRSKRIFCRPCLDWSERRPHLGGRVGAAICAHCVGRGWLTRRRGSRTLDVSREGMQALAGVFGDSLRDLSLPS